MALDTSDLTAIGLRLPPEVVVLCPDAVAGYLRAHPDLVSIVGEMAAALVDEFRGERSQIQLDVDEDDYVDEKYLVFNVRVATYDESFMDRIETVSERFDNRLTTASGWMLLTTDFAPVG